MKSKQTAITGNELIRLSCGYVGVENPLNKQMTELADSRLMSKRLLDPKEPGGLSTEGRDHVEKLLGVKIDLYPPHLDNDYLTWFVTGATMRYMELTGQGTVRPEYLQATIGIVHRYLHGRQTLDGSCSDFQCTIAHAAEKVFGTFD